MATNLTGYRGDGRSTPVLDGILNQHKLNLNMPGDWLIRELWNGNLVPYARAHWAYNGATCNCQDLAEAIVATWAYIRTRRSPDAGETSRAEQDTCLAGNALGATGIVCKAMPALGGIARGNVFQGTTGMQDGRALFGDHTIARIGIGYYDLTYVRTTTNKTDIVDSYLGKKVAGTFWFTLNNARMFIRNAALRPPGFVDSWWEMDSTGFITPQDWAERSGRGTLHTRSKELRELDATLQYFFDNGWVGYLPLKTAFTNWIKKNPKEAKERNARGCVEGLAHFLHVTPAQFGVTFY